MINGFIHDLLNTIVKRQNKSCEKNQRTKIYDLPILNTHKLFLGPQGNNYLKTAPPPVVHHWLTESRL